LFPLSLISVGSLLLMLQISPASTPGNAIPDAAAAASHAAASAPSTYTLGPGDQIVVRAADIEEITDKPIPIDSRGYVDLPMIGRMLAAGLTTEQLEADAQARMKKYLVDPKISIYVAEIHSQPISVLGAVQQPGVHQLQGQKTLFEVLSLAGGLKDNSGNVVKVTRKLAWGRIPLPDAKDDPSGQFSVASVDVKEIMSASNPAANIVIKPEDVISVPRADVIYAIGAVKKPGGYMLGVNQSLSVLQILSLAEGLEKVAAISNSRIMRVVPGTTNRTEIPVDLKKILASKGSDIPLQADDILFIPVSTAKSVGYRTLEAIAQASTYTLYRIP